MPRQKRPRPKGMGTKYLVVWLRKTLEDPRATIAQRIKCLDRLAMIDDVYKVVIAEPNDNGKQPVETTEADQLDKMAEEALDKYHREAKRKLEETNAYQLSQSGEVDGS